MNNRDTRSILAVMIVVAFSLLVVLFSGCGENTPSSSDNVVSDLVMTSAVDDYGRPLNRTTVFSDNASAFICSFKIANFPVGSEIKAQWIYVGGNPAVEEVVGTNTMIQETIGTIQRKGKGYTCAVWQIPPLPGYTWPHGNYKVVLSVGGEEKGTAYFKVE